MAKRNRSVQGTYKNILNVYSRATQNQIDKGLSFYEDAREDAYIIGKQLGYKGSNAVMCGAGILSVLSPRTDYELNRQMAYDLANGLYIQQTEANKAKAIRIMQGENPMLVMGRDSHKTKPFFKAILNPLGNNEVYGLTGYGNKPTHLAVIDRHAGGVYKGLPLSEKQREQIGNWRVNKRISNSYFRACKVLNLPVNILQGITWYVFRDLYKNKRLYTIKKGN